jgi:signal transduction histidine kinase
VPVRLVALIVIPTAVAGLLAGLRVSAALDNTAGYERVQQLARLGDKVSVLAHGLEAERDLSATSVAARSRDNAALRKLREAVDVAARDVRTEAGAISDSQPPVVRAKVRDILNRLDKLPALRHVSTETKVPAAAAIDAYGQFIFDLIGLDDLIAQGSSETGLAETARALGTLARAKEHSSRERALLSVALSTGGFQRGAFVDLLAARAQRDSELAAFRSSATTAQLQQYYDTVTGPEVDRAEFTRERAVDIAGHTPDLTIPRISRTEATRWFEDMTVRLDRMRTVEDALAKSVIGQSGALKDKAQRAAIMDGGLLLLVLAFVLAATVVVARSLVRPLRRLRSGALEVAGSRLPDLVRQLGEPGGTEVDLEVKPIDVHSTDEIGEVARSFDEVHREAVRLAANEAVLRGNINAMFVNLSRRSQSLIERQLRLIDDLEQGEENDERLANLFRLDHLATRMRRNCENLLVLGGQEQVRRWNQPVPLVDIVRASLSEVEQYDRIGVRVQSEISILGPVVNDLIHLLAELVENATVFSPEHTKVTISGHLLSGGGAMLQITDNGVGMSAEELEDANWRLANPPVLEASVARRMGLFVVGRLAGRHGIRVELRAALSGGITAFVLLPARVVAAEETQDDRWRDLDAFMADIPAAASALPAAAMIDAHTGGQERGRPSQGRWEERPAALDELPPHVREPVPGRQPIQEPVHHDLLHQDLLHQKPGHQKPAHQEPRTAPPLRPSGPQEEAQGRSERAHTGPQPGIGGITGPQGVAGHTVPQDGLSSETGPQPGFGSETGAQQSFGSETGPQQAGDHHTGPQPTPGAPSEAPAFGGHAPAQPGGFGWDTGPQQAVGHDRESEPGPDRHTGPQRGAGWNTGPQPVPGGHTGLQPAVGGHTGPQPIPGLTGPQPAPGASGPQPAVRAEHRHAPAPPAAPPPSPAGLPLDGSPSRREPPVRQERSPIFDAMESEWFQRRTAGSPVASGSAVPAWRSPADEGWQAAEALREPSSGGHTAAGLPKRVPGKNRVPGAVRPAPIARPAGSAPAPQVPPQSADTIRNRFASFQRGVHRGRSETVPDDSSRTGETP